MKLQPRSVLFAALLVATSALSRRSSSQDTTRPSISYSPKYPSVRPPAPALRTRICEVQSNNDITKDDAPHILAALTDCNHGGHAVFGEHSTYFVATALDLTFLANIDLGHIRGTVLFSDDTDYWQKNSFPFVFQNVTSFFKLGGTDVNIYGGGTLNGNGQVWYDLYASEIYTLRPVLIGIDGLHDSIISNLVLRYSPEYYVFIANSTNVVFDNIDISGYSKSKNLAKNTDGWDTYRSSDLVIQNSVINNGDDCVSFKPNSTDILVQNLKCNGSHGISVGSLGQYEGEFDIVENIYVYNISMTNASNGARIKVWPNAPSALSGDLQGGGGEGRVNNITYDTLSVANTDYAIELYQCYGQKNLTLCTEHPSLVNISNVVFKNFTGTTSSTWEPQIAAFACSSSTACNNITATQIKVTSPGGKDEALCLNVDKSSLDVKCVGNSLGFS